METPIKEILINNKGESPEKDQFVYPHLEGVKTLFVMNRKHRFFLPSSKNYFGLFQARFAMHDSGCNTHLLAPESSDDLLDVLKNYPPQSLELVHTFSESKGVSGKHILMSISYRDKHPFEVKLCQDIFGEMVTTHVPTLRWYLCSEDVDLLLSGNLLTTSQHQILERFRTRQSFRTERRTHSLIGQDLFYGFGSFSYMNITILTDPRSFDPTNLFQKLEELSGLFLDSPFLPENFDSLESEDVTRDDIFDDDIQIS